jgi:glycosyltransferase involved in cell wall biosynthesis
MRPGLERGGIPGRSIRVLRNPIRPFTDARVHAERNREFLFIGRLDPEKGPDIAASAATSIGAALRVIGDGPMYEKLRRDYPEVIFEGRKTHEEMGRLVASARALIVPSRYPEPFGLAAGEALWSGLPVIFNQTALMADEIVRRGAGLACNIYKDGDLAATLKRVLAGDAETECMSKSAFDSTRYIGHTPAEWADRLIAIYQELVGTS